MTGQHLPAALSLGMTSNQEEVVMQEMDERHVADALALASRYGHAYHVMRDLDGGVHVTPVLLEACELLRTVQPAFRHEWRYMTQEEDRDTYGAES